MIFAPTACVQSLDAGLGARFAGEEGHAPKLRTDRERHQETVIGSQKGTFPGSVWLSTHGPGRVPVFHMTAVPMARYAPPTLPAIRRRLFLRRRIMSHALERAEHYRDLARRYLRLAASTENPNHYLRIAVQY